MLLAERQNFLLDITLNRRVRRLKRCALAGTAVQGGSTLTQQLVKNFYLQPEHLLWRKLQEGLMALLLEWHYSKDDILALPAIT